MRAADDSGNLESPGSQVAVSVVAKTCPCSIWDNNFTGPQDADAQAVELGAKFRSDVAGFITGIRFYKTSGNTGTHIGRLWTAGGTQLAQATFTGETASGWQQVNFGAPVAIDANTTYVASYHAPNGHYSSRRRLLRAGRRRQPAAARAGRRRRRAQRRLQVRGCRLALLRGRAQPRSTRRPIWSTSSSTLQAAPTRPRPRSSPALPPMAPAASRARATSPRPSTRRWTRRRSTARTVFLQRPRRRPGGGDGELFARASRRATLDPTAALQGSTTYTATIKGGPDGVADLAGNPLVADSSWSFTTAGPPPPPPDEGPGGPILVISNAANPFSRYYAEILRAEGLNEFKVTDLANVTPATAGRLRRRDPRRDQPERGPGHDPERLGPAGRQPDRDAPGSPARRPCSASPTRPTRSPTAT